MELKAQLRISAPRAKVFAGLNDPVILQQAIPGCEELIAVSATEFAATVATKIGPLTAKFKGGVSLSDIKPPESYTLTGEGKGGPAGFAKVRAFVHLAEDGNATLMTYEVKADVGGKLGQLGGAMIERTSKKLAGEFFQKFEELLGAEDPAAAETETTANVAASQAAKSNTLLWVGIGAAVVIAAAYLLLK